MLTNSVFLFSINSLTKRESHHNIVYSLMGLFCFFWQVANFYGIFLKFTLNIVHHRPICL